MKHLIKFLALTVLVAGIRCKSFDDGKYNPKKYRVYDDGKYYRPLDEGKYIPGDEGRYTYIYNNILYPALPYEHVNGPSGGFGGNGGAGGDGSYGGNGPDGPNGPDAPYTNQYIGRKIYAPRFPYGDEIKALIKKYVSTDSLFGDTPEGSANHFSQVHSDNESTVKCRYLSPEKDGAEFVTQYPPRMELNQPGKLGAFYSFKGSKIVNRDKNEANSKIKLEYEVFVRVVEVSE